MPLRTHVDEQPAMNLTSMIDVIMLLLIFFMVGTKFSEMERDIDLQVPRVASSPALSAAPSKRLVNVYLDGRITLDNRDVDLEELSAQLSAARRQYDDLAVLVRGDGRGPFQRVAEVLRACKDAGIADLAISVRLSEPEK
jgi:biopolymer transport protein ExbD